MRISLRRCIVVFAFICLHIFTLMRGTIHKAHLSSGWYPQKKMVLENDLERYFLSAQKQFSINVDSSKIRALIAPHAGYGYSGVCAASAYHSLLSGNEKNKHIKKVIVLAPLHSVGLKGIALPDYDAYQTVLGAIAVDNKAIKNLQEDDLFKIVSGIHDKEHSLEVQLPFLQQTIQQFKLIPLIVGDLQPQQYGIVAKALSKIIDDQTLVVISSDFIHFGQNYGYMPFTINKYLSVRRLDSRAVETIAGLSFDLFSVFLQKTKATICGRNPIKILLRLAESGAFGEVTARMPGYYMSPQTNNRFSIVPDEQMGSSVSYAGLIFSTQDFNELPPDQQFTGYEKHALLQLARDSIANEFKGKTKVSESLLYPVLSPCMHKIAGAFVTLNTKKGVLRGCIGRIVTTLPLYATIASMAKSAAFHDSRFSPLKKEELKDIVVDITVLTPPKKVASYQAIVLGKHGIILEKNGRQAVFLPQVPGQFKWDLATTLEHLSVKAGLSKDAWKKGCTFKVFEGFEIKEN